MRTIPIELCDGADDQTNIAAIERACAAAGLRLTMKGTLRAYRGCVHWHFKRGRERGTLEATSWPRERRAWFSVHAGRSAAWIANVLPRIKESLDSIAALPEQGFPNP